MVSVSFSCTDENWTRISDLKKAIEADRMKETSLSSIVNELVKLGFTYREYLRNQKVTK